MALRAHNSSLCTHKEVTKWEKMVINRNRWHSTGHNNKKNYHPRVQPSSAAGVQRGCIISILGGFYALNMKLWATQSELRAILTVSGVWAKDLLWSLPVWVILQSYDLHLSPPFKTSSFLHIQWKPSRTDWEMPDPKYHMSQWQKHSSRRWKIPVQIR